MCLDLELSNNPLISSVKLAYLHNFKTKVEFFNYDLDRTGRQNGVADEFIDLQCPVSLCIERGGEPYVEMAIDLAHFELVETLLEFDNLGLTENEVGQIITLNLLDVMYLAIDKTGEQLDFEIESTDQIRWRFVDLAIHDPRQMDGCVVYST